MVNKDYPTITLNLAAGTKIKADGKLTGVTTTDVTTFKNGRAVENKLFVIDNGNLTVNGQDNATITYTGGGDEKNASCFLVLYEGKLTVNNTKLQYTGNEYDTVAVVHMIGGYAYLNNGYIDAANGAGVFAETLQTINKDTFDFTVDKTSYVEVNNCTIIDRGIQYINDNIAITASGNSHVIVRGGTYKASQCVVMARSKGGTIDLYDGEFIQTDEYNLNSEGKWDSTNPNINAK